MNYKDIESAFYKAFSQMGLILFKPFSLKKWIVLAFICFLAGVLSSGFSGNYSPSYNSPTQKSQLTQTSTNSTGQLRQQSSQPVDPSESVQAALASLNAPSDSSLEDEDSVGKGLPSPAQMYEKASNLPWGVIIAFSSLIILITVAFSLLMSWIASRFNFIFYNSVTQNSVEIKKPWADYKAQGNSFYKFLLLQLGIVALVFIVVLFGGFLTFSSFATAQSFSSVNWGPLLSFGLLGLLIWVVLALIFHYVQQFVIPIMAHDKVSFLPALHIFLQIFKSRFWAFILYLPIAFVLGIVCAIVVGLICIGLILLLLILGLILFLIPYLILGGESTLFLTYAICMGIIFVLLFSLSIILANVPVAVFYRAFTLAFLEKAAPEYLFYQVYDKTVVPPPFPS